MKKILALIIFISFIVSKAFSQEDNKLLHQKDSALPMNTVQVKKITTVSTIEQKKPVKKYKKSYKPPKSLEIILTPEEKEKLKHKNNQPRRGVTNMPNERTAK